MSRRTTIATHTPTAIPTHAAALLMTASSRKAKRINQNMDGT